MNQPLLLNVLERQSIVPSWITVLLVLCLLLLVFLKAIDNEKFYGSLTSFFNKGFLEIQAEEKQSPFNLFSSLFTIFSLISISLVFYLSLNYLKDESISIIVYLETVFFVMIYLIGRFVTEYFLIQLFSLKSYLNLFFLSKQNYLFSMSVGIYVCTFVYVFSGHNIQIFWIVCGLLFSIRSFTIISTNKNLIFSNLFYFILYLCAFEIAPLVVLFKLMTK